ncbi:MAG TPA: MFS transporter [Caulobacteraceae bacterium]|nr:MFS transporter [Caulobacteraceae bacterium]
MSVQTTPAVATLSGAPLPRVLAFATMAAPTAALAVVTNVYLPRYYVGLGLSFIVVGAAITGIRLIDLCFDPLLSLVMDRTKTPIGRYRPWLILGAPIVMLAIHMLLTPGAGLTPGYMMVWLLVIGAGTSMVSLGQAAWASVLATSYNDRSRVYGWVQGLSAVGQMSILLLPPIFTAGAVVLGKADSMPAIGWILVIALPVCLLICTAFTPERRATLVERPRFSLPDMVSAVSRPAALRAIIADFLMSLAPGAAAPLYVYFFHEAKGFTASEINVALVVTILGSAVGAPVWARIARRFNKHRTLQFACVCYAAFHASVVALPRGQFVLTVAAMAAVGFCSAALVPLVRAMVADISDEVRLERDQNLTSLLFSMVTTTQKVGATITVLFVFPVLAFVGYNGKEGAVNTPQSIVGLEMCYLLIPMLAVLAGGAMFFGYKLSPERHAAVRRELEARDAAALQAAPPLAS